MSRVRFLTVTDTRLLQAVNTRLKGRFSDSATRLPTLLVPLLVVLSVPVLLLGCDAKNQRDTAPIAETTASNSISTPQALEAASGAVNSAVNSAPTAAVSDVAGAAHAKVHTGQAAPAEFSQSVPPSTRDYPVQIDWTQIDTKVTPVAIDTFDYPLAINSAPVKAFADFAKVTPKQAQHTLTVSTASNEAVVKLLDQLGDSYVSHKVTDDGGQLIVYTTPNVVASHFDYVLADDFARGLVLPIEIQPQLQ